MFLNSAPKAYNLDKMLEILAKEKSVFMFYFVGVSLNKTVKAVLISMFQNDLRNTIYLLKHWAGRNSRGVSQFNGQTIHNLIKSPNNDIDTSKSQAFIKSIMKL